MDDRTWTERALCTGKTALFFGTPRERPGRRARREALANAYCSVCPVMETCRTAGREGREFGMWGGETEEDRARLGYPPPAMMRRSVVAAAREGRSLSEMDEPDAEDLLEAELLEAELLEDGMLDDDVLDSGVLDGATSGVGARR